MLTPEQLRDHLGHLKKVPRSYGKVRRVSDLVQNAIDEQRETNQPQIIALIGSVGTLQSYTASRITEAFASVDKTTVLIDEADSKNEPTALEEATIQALHKHSFIVIRSSGIPHTNGITNRSFAEVLQKIAQHKDHFSPFNHTFRALAKIETLSSFRRDVQISKIIETAKDISLRNYLLNNLGIFLQGNSLSGIPTSTLLEDFDYQLNYELSNLCSNSTIRPPRLGFHSHQSFQIAIYRAVTMARSLYPWLLGQYFGVPEDHAIVCEDKERRKITLDFTATDQHRFIPQLIAQGRINELV